ncbi:mitochondrial editing factor 9 [Actinidia rufa]|uniref:Mitochondrial editing factor 9 n=1 Tax=Actinidia rufa TaxID=165716 RepID=A0A7J0F763_9ERIC|nr:mitochondrial editing factor 9 [Actinidia rufa]
MPERDFVSWNTMITGYARNGRMEEALCLFNNMPKRNVVSWNAIISGFLDNGDVKSAIEYFERMPERDAASLSALVSGLIQNGELDKAAGILLGNGGRTNGKEDLIHAYNTLIAGFAQKGKVDDARRLFDQIPFHPDCKRGDTGGVARNVVSWNSMIMCYVKIGDIFSARELFDQMMERDTFSWNTLISGYVNLSDMEEASNLFCKMPDPDTLSWNSMISGFSQMGNLVIACDFFGRMPQKNLVSWNSMISGFEKNGDCDGAIMLFIQMQAEGEKPDQHTLSSLLRVCAEAVALQLGMQIHQQVIKAVIPDIPLNNSFITMYARCGAIMQASLECMCSCWPSGGRSDAFRSMVSEFGIEARVEHYASLVDIVGRHGQIEEAIIVIKSMPFEPDKVVWGALLGACRVHNNVELARVAAEALTRLEPESSATYVLLYNIGGKLQSTSYMFNKIKSQSCSYIICKKFCQCEIKAWRGHPFVMHCSALRLNDH